MDTPLDRVLDRLRWEMSAFKEGSEPYLLVRDALADLCVGNARPLTLQLLAEKSRHWFDQSINAPSDVFAAEQAGLQLANHSILYEQLADDFEDVLHQLRPSGQLQESFAG